MGETVLVDLVFRTKGGKQVATATAKLKGLKGQGAGAAKSLTGAAGATNLLGSGALAAAGPIGIAVAAVAALTLGATKLSQALKDSIFDTANTRDEIAKLSQQVGVSVEDLSALRLAARLSGITMSDIAGGVRLVSKNLLDAQNNTGEARLALVELGIDAHELNLELTSGTDIMALVADRFAQMEDGARKTALAQKVFGRSGATLIPLLNKGSQGIEQMVAQAERLGVTFDREAAAKSEAFNDSLVVLEFAMEGVEQKIGEALIPVLTQLVLGFTENEAAMKALDVLARATAGGILLVVGAAAEGTIALIELTQTALRGVADSLPVVDGLAASLDLLGPAGRGAAKVLRNAAPDFDTLRSSAESLNDPLKILRGVSGSVGDALLSLAAQSVDTGEKVRKNLNFDPDPSNSVLGLAEALARAEQEALDLARTSSSIPRSNLPSAHEQVLSALGLDEEGIQRTREEGERRLRELRQDILLGDALRESQELSKTRFDTPDENGGNIINRLITKVESPEAPPSLEPFQEFSTGISEIFLGVEGSFGLYQGAIEGANQAWAAFITGQVSGKQALKSVVASSIAALSQESFQRGLVHLAQGFAALTPWGAKAYGPASHQFKSAGLWFLAAGASGAGSRGASGGSGPSSQPGTGFSSGGFSSFQTPNQPLVLDVSALRLSESGSSAPLSGQSTGNSDFASKLGELLALQRSINEEMVGIMAEASESSREMSQAARHLQSMPPGEVVFKGLDEDGIRAVPSNFIEEIGNRAFDRSRTI